MAFADLARIRLAAGGLDGVGEGGDLLIANGPSGSEAEISRQISIR